ncbi:MAG: UDP-3-O-acyl-N-acetylglucosamine deacetylase [Planctomycetota bacterium]|nr:UDP-3-O-acyl-N-acetylglucosamine deacetylase [Planctomycetota bacterium]
MSETVAEPRFQRTIKKAFKIEGQGIHTGKVVHVECEPAAPGDGIVFFRSDVPDSGPIPALATHKTPFPRRTALADEGGKAEVHTVEHMLSAAHALGLDNLKIRFDAAEAPALDGSSLNFLELFREAGIDEQDQRVEPIRLDKAIGVHHGDSAVVALPWDGPGLKISYTLDYPVASLGAQHITLTLSEESFEKLIAPARTFCLEAEAQALRNAGMGLGANFQNTVVYGESGAIETELRFPDEAVRHKVLDLIGDLSLLGRPLQAFIVAVKSGHDLNALLAKEILKHTMG